MIPRRGYLHVLIQGNNDLFPVGFIARKAYLIYSKKGLNSIPFRPIRVKVIFHGNLTFLYILKKYKNELVSKSM